MEDKIIIRSARVHNLQNISLTLPKNKLVVFSGVSGSGKSSLAFDTIFAEGQRRYIESLSPYARQFLGQMERPDIDEIIGLSPAIAIDQKGLSHNPRSTVGTLTEIYDYLRVLFARLGKVYCPLCNEKIEKLTIEEIINIIEKESKQAKNQEVTILSPVVRGRKGEYYQLFYDFMSLGYTEAIVNGKSYSLKNPIHLSRYKNHDIDIVMDRVNPKEESRLFEAVENALHYSKGLVKIVLNFNNVQSKTLLLSNLRTCLNDNFSFPEVEPRLFSFNSPYGACPKCHGLGKLGFMLDIICDECQNKRLKPEALAVKIKGKNIYEISALTIEKAYEFFVGYEASLGEKEITIAHNLLKEIISRLSFLLEVGLDYLTLDREAHTLSGGEAQRIRLASQIGSQLSNTLYVLDEPTIGLHERDTQKLINTLQMLKKQNNTVIIVEHDEKTILSADYLVDLGPGAGKNGGKIVAEGYLSDLLKNPPEDSQTLKYLKKEKQIFLPHKRRTNTTEKIKIVGARANNLKNINVEIPLRKFVCITGLSGSGKSSLLYDVLYDNAIKIKNFQPDKLENVSKIDGLMYVDKIIKIDQSPIGRTPRSNPATYTGIFTPIREFYAQLDSARERGYSASRFSFNVEGGRCEACQGAGSNLIEMHFLPSVTVKCDVCQGKRFNRETLQVKYKGKTISDVLNMTIDGAAKFFANIYQISEKLNVLREVGLGYLQLGQSATTLSGGEAQRIKLGRELTHPLGKRTLYLLDEPTVGLHYQDVEMLLRVLDRLVSKGNSVLVIEHNMHVAKFSDYIIDLGPEGGEKGGKLVSRGTPEEIATNPNSLTGKYLKDYLI